MVIGLLCILLLTVTVVVVKVTMIDPKVDTNISTFKPLAQQINSNSKYTDVGYIPCNGYVPCMVSYYIIYLCLWRSAEHLLSIVLESFIVAP